MAGITNWMISAIVRRRSPLEPWLEVKAFWLSTADFREWERHKLRLWEHQGEEPFDAFMGRPVRHLEELQDSLVEFIGADLLKEAADG